MEQKPIAETMKLLEENKGVSLCDLGIGNCFLILDMTPKAQTKKQNKTN